MKTPIAIDKASRIMTQFAKTNFADHRALRKRAKKARKAIRAMIAAQREEIRRASANGTRTEELCSDLKRLKAFRKAVKTARRLKEQELEEE